MCRCTNYHHSLYITRHDGIILQLCYTKKQFYLINYFYYLDTMKKIILVIALLILAAVSTIPYWTGIEAEKRFTKLNHKFYPAANMKLVDTTYQRGWFRSVAQSTFEMSEASNTAANDGRLTFVHDIDHGFLPITDATIHTTLRTGSDMEVQSTEGSKIEAQASTQKFLNNIFVSTSVSEKPTLLDMRTKVQINGDTVSTLKIPPLTVKYDKAHLQWQGLQGKVYTKHNLAAVRTEIHTPQIQLETDKGRIVVQNAKLQISVQPGADSKQSASLSIADILLHGKQTPQVKLEGIQVEGNNNIVSNKLMITVKTGLLQAQVGADRYGPGYGDFELKNWHMPTLSRLQNTWVKTQNQGLPKEMAMLRLAPEGMALLKHSPEFAITRLNLNMPEGEVRGQLWVKMAPFEGGIFALFNPQLLINAISAQLEMHIPQALLRQLTEETSPGAQPTARKTIGQHLKTWVEKGILIPDEDNKDYYRSQIHLEGGVLQVNGQPRPIAVILPD
ncbi:MAG: hypothetical protein DRR08_21340 [Candidatus Parabeggiatoa sp. nov. 2]|nr:MAG: hypothetical protein DRR08_21340 [Gammaproteobacteria bacterium]